MNEEPVGQVLSDSPFIRRVDAFVEEDERQALLDAARPQLQRALVSAAHAGVESAGRTGRNCWVPHATTPVIQALAERIAVLADLPLTHAESFQVIHYGESEEYRPHYDAWKADTERGQRCMVRGGQRLVTCLVYLNDVASGGATCFPRLKLEIPARAGDLLLFHNCHPGTITRHPDTLHGGMPVLKGVKWAANLWFRERPRQ
ncbi:MAG: 2OG-Fe(II) oxygenase [Pseudohongiellaceae bacterium]